MLLTYIGFDGMVGKLSVSAFQNFFWIEKFWKAETESFPTIPSNPVYIKAC